MIFIAALFLLLSAPRAGAQPTPAGLPPPAVLRGHTGPVFFLAFPGKDLLISAAADGARVWNPENGTLIRELPEKELISAAYAEGPGLLALGLADGSIVIYSSGSWTETDGPYSPGRPALSLAFSRGNEYLAASGGDGRVRFWKTAGWSLEQELEAYPGSFSLAGFSGSGTLLASFSPGEPQLRLWDRRTGKPRYWLKSPHTLSAFFDPRGRRLAAAAADRTLRVWEPGGAAAPARLEIAAGPLAAAAFSASGGLLAAAGLDGSITIWDSDRGTKAGEIRDSRTRSLALAFSPSGTSLATGEAGGEIKVRLWADYVWTSTGGVRVIYTGSETIGVLAAGSRLKVLKAEPGAGHWLVTDGSGTEGWAPASGLSPEKPDTSPPLIQITSRSYSGGFLSLRGSVTDDGRLDYVRFSGKTLHRPADSAQTAGPDAWPFEIHIEVTPNIDPVIEAGDFSGKTNSLPIILVP